MASSAARTSAAGNGQRAVYFARAAASFASTLIGSPRPNGGRIDQENMDRLRFCRHRRCNAGEYNPWKQQVPRGRSGDNHVGLTHYSMHAGAALRSGIFFCIPRPGDLGLRGRRSYGPSDFYSAAGSRHPSTRNPSRRHFLNLAWAREARFVLYQRMNR
jgi:hypothetical protein